MDIEKCFNKALENLNELEQYMRRQNILIYGLNDIPSKSYDFEFVKYVCRKLNALLPNLEFGEITPDDINDAHPMFTKSGSKPIVIVQFSKHWIRNKVLKKKNQLSQNNVSFSEHLASQNMKLLKAAKSIVGPYYAFSLKGVVYGRVDDLKITVKSQQDLEELKQLVETAHTTHRNGIQIPPKNNTVSSSSTALPLTENGNNGSGTMTYNAGYVAPNPPQNYAPAPPSNRGWGNRGSSHSRGRGSTNPTSRGSYHLRGRGHFMTTGINGNNY